MTIDLVPTMAVLASATVVIGGVFAGLRWLGKKFDRRIHEVAVSSRKTADQLQTSNGTTVAGYVEKTSKALDHITDRLDEQAKRAAENYQIATAASTAANLANDRLDRHLVTDHGAAPAPREED